MNENENVTRNDGCEVRPPIGLCPRYVVETKRLRDLLQAAERYVEAGLKIPNEWHDELFELWDKYDNAACSKKVQTRYAGMTDPDSRFADSRFDPFGPGRIERWVRDEYEDMKRRSNPET